MPLSRSRHAPSEGGLWWQDSSPFRPSFAPHGCRHPDPPRLAAMAPQLADGPTRTMPDATLCHPQVAPSPDDEEGRHPLDRGPLLPDPAFHAQGYQIQKGLDPVINASRPRWWDLASTLRWWMRASGVVRDVLGESFCSVVECWCRWRLRPLMSFPSWRATGDAFARLRLHDRARFGWLCDSVMLLAALWAAC